MVNSDVCVIVCPSVRPRVSAMKTTTTTTKWTTAAMAVGSFFLLPFFFSLFLSDSSAILPVLSSRLLRRRSVFLCQVWTADLKTLATVEEKLDVLHRGKGGRSRFIEDNIGKVSQTQGQLATPKKKNLVHVSGHKSRVPEWLRPTVGGVV